MGDALDRARAAMHAVPGPQSCSLQGLQSGTGTQSSPPAAQQPPQEQNYAGAGVESGGAKRKAILVKADTFSVDARYPVCEHCKFMGDAKQLHKKSALEEEGGAAGSVVAAAAPIVESSSSSGGGGSMSTGIPAAAAVAVVPPARAVLGVSGNDIGGMRAEIPVSGE